MPERKSLYVSLIVKQKHFELLYFLKMKWLLLLALLNLSLEGKNCLTANSTIVFLKNMSQYVTGKSCLFYSKSQYSDDHGFATKKRVRT